MDPVMTTSMGSDETERTLTSTSATAKLTEDGTNDPQQNGISRVRKDLEVLSI